MSLDVSVVTNNPGYRITPNSNPLFCDHDNVMFSWYPTVDLQGKYSNDLPTLINKIECNVFVNLTRPEENLKSYEDIIRKNINAKREYNSSIVINYPIVDKTIPNNMVDFNNFIETLHHLYKLKYKILIHCRGGHGRSGLVSACLMIKMGFTSEQALNQVSVMHKTRLYIPNYPCPDTEEQKDFVRKYEEYVINNLTNIN